MNSTQIDRLIAGKEAGLRKKPKNKALKNIDDLIEKGVITEDGRARLEAGLEAGLGLV